MSGGTVLRTQPATGPAAPRQRWLARLAFAAAFAAAVVLLVAAGLRGSIALLVVATVGLALALAAAWWFLTRRGVLRWLAATLVLAAPLTVALMYVRAGLLWLVLLCAALWAGAGVAGRAALDRFRPPVPVEYETPPPRRPYLIMNPRSGGGKVARFDLAQRARKLGAEVVLLDGPGLVDVTELARQAVRDGADLLGVAGGDGTQALVAAVAAENGVPFMVISAGTRNHFAMDLGLDREDPSICLEALTDGVELRVDLGLIGDRTFVNNASFGAYAAVVRSPAYRANKTVTTLDMLPDLLSGHDGPFLRLRVGDAVVYGPQAVLVSNNPYAAGDVAGLGRRDRVDAGILGVLAVSVSSTADAVLLLRGRRSTALTVLTAPEAIIESDSTAIPVGIDGEAVMMPSPVRCTIRPGALRVRVPRRRPGVRAPEPELNWTRLRQLAGPAWLGSSG